MWKVNPIQQYHLLEKTLLIIQESFPQTTTIMIKCLTNCKSQCLCTAVEMLTQSKLMESHAELNPN